MNHSIKYYIGVDGGGTGTRVVITDLEFKTLATATGDASALGQGVQKSWTAILETISKAFIQFNRPIPRMSECSIAIGISGANNITWKNEFYFRNPGFLNIKVETDALTTLLGAHEGKPGVIISIGTGSVGMLLDENFEQKTVSGFGYPSGDEASGAWLGLKAASLAQKALDKRIPNSPLTESILKFCNFPEMDFITWLGCANQNTFAKLAPIVFENANKDSLAKNLLIKAGEEVSLMHLALDENFKYPFSICGNLGKALKPYLPSKLESYLTNPKFDSAQGALYLLK